MHVYAFVAQSEAHPPRQYSVRSPYLRRAGVAEADVKKPNAGGRMSAYTGLGLSIRAVQRSLLDESERAADGTADDHAAGAPTVTTHATRSADNKMRLLARTRISALRPLFVIYRNS